MSDENEITLYGPNFETRLIGGGMPPRPALTFNGGETLHENFDQAVAAYESFIRECDRHDIGIPADAWFFVGTPEGDESDHGYPEGPEFMLCVDPDNPEAIDWEGSRVPEGYVPEEQRDAGLPGPGG